MSTTEFEHIFFPEEKSWVAPMNHKERYTLPNSEFLESDGEINQQPAISTVLATKDK